MPFLVAWKNMFSLEITRTYEYNITYQVIQSVTFFYPRYLQVTWTHHPPKEVTCSWSLVPGRRGPGSWKQRGPPAGQHQRCFCSRNVPFGDGFKLVGVGGVCCFLCVVTFSWVCVCVCELHEPFKAKWTTWRRWGMLKIGVPHSIKCQIVCWVMIKDMKSYPLALTPMWRIFRTAKWLWVCHSPCEAVFLCIDATVMVWSFWAQNGWKNTPKKCLKHVHSPALWLLHVLVGWFG